MTNRIAEFRKAQGLTQPQLAELLGYKSYQMIQALELGKRTPSVELAIRIARALQTTVEELFVIEEHL